VSMVSCSDDSTLGNTLLKIFGSYKTIGICDPLDISDDDKALVQFNSSFCSENSRYQIQWPWKYKNIDIPDNLDVAISRLRSLARLFYKDRNLLEKSDEVISNQVEQGIVKKVTAVTKTNQQCHYLPHHPVITPDKNTIKLCVVYDASVEEFKCECLH